MVRFPENLPNALFDGHSKRKVDGVQRTQMQSGRTFSRLEFSDTPSDFSLSWRMTQEQAFQFENWHSGAIKGGSLEFIMPVMMTDGFRDRVCKFMGMYQGPDRIGPNTWELTAPVQVRDQVGEGFDPEWWKFSEWIEYASLFDVTMNKHWPEV